MANFVKLLRGGAETWVLNEIIDVGKYGLDVALIKFISSSKNWVAISGKDEGGLFYEDYDSNYTMVFNEADGTWVDQSYRTITFLEPPADVTFSNIVDWLQANGVKQ